MVTTYFYHNFLSSFFVHYRLNIIKNISTFHMYGLPWGHKTILPQRSTFSTFPVHIIVQKCISATSSTSQVTKKGNSGRES